MKKLTWFLAAILSFVVSLGGVSPAFAAPSSYQFTCSNISVSDNVLSASCKRRNQSYNRTSIVLKAIENIDGTLNFTDPRKDANFNLSCKDTSVSGDRLSGKCQKIDGSYVDTAIAINGIENIDGNLTYTSNPIRG
ncbi:CVNH domain-containing protein [Dolichospermum planctonicum UHCC 0167]|uniref:mannose-binding lectin n=1 Tax=Dolichospermum planctonicum TaxID=136072 RepID=UPI0014437650|nr:CVNH domain-containing protein [Dolichospermum planctonicum]MCW9679636.1 CVNH domain-containing protein [Dolichospermum planctonicum UHCC 0167]